MEITEARRVRRAFFMSSPRHAPRPVLARQTINGMVPFAQRSPLVTFNYSFQKLK